MSVSVDIPPLKVSLREIEIATSKAGRIFYDLVLTLSSKKKNSHAFLIEITKHYIKIPVPGDNGINVLH